MENKSVLTKILATVGTVLVWFPILALVIFSTAFITRTGILRIDYLIPAEFFPVALVGGALLVWAAIKCHTRIRLIGWCFGIAIVSLFGGQLLAVFSGVNSGKTEMTTVMFIILLGSILVYSLALIATGVGGVLLLKDLFKPGNPASQPK